MPFGAAASLECGRPSVSAVGSRRARRCRGLFLRGKRKSAISSPRALTSALLAVSLDLCCNKKRHRCCVSTYLSVRLWASGCCAWTMGCEGLLIRALEARV